MMDLALARCFAPPQVTAVIIDPLESNVRAIAFYRRLGFIPVGLRVFGDDRCLVHQITREQWDLLQLGDSN
jgi:aminoglycoside 6'-N-acetyltransferase